MVFEATITHVIADAKGNDKTVKENFIFENNELFGEVEAKLYEEFGELTGFEVVAIKKDSKIREIVNKRENEFDKIFIAELASLFLDEVTGEEKATIYKVALFAGYYDLAYKKVTEYMKQGLEDLELVSLKKTNFVDVL